jgi:hypothetical protein
MGGSCNMNGIDEKCTQNFSGKLEGKTHVGDKGGDGWITLKRTLPE